MDKQYLASEDVAQAFTETDTFQLMVEEGHYNNDFCTERCLDAMVMWAERLDIELIGLDDFEFHKFDGFFQQAYNSATKGLSHAS